MMDIENIDSVVRYLNEQRAISEHHFKDAVIELLSMIEEGGGRYHEDDF